MREWKLGFRGSDWSNTVKGLKALLAFFVGIQHAKQVFRIVASLWILVLIFVANFRNFVLFIEVALSSSDFEIASHLIVHLQTGLHMLCLYRKCIMFCFLILFHVWMAPTK